MHTVTLAQLGFPNANGNYATEASTLGLKPGQVPTYIVADGYEFKLFGVRKSTDGDVAFWTYLSNEDMGNRFGRELTVFND